MFSLGEGWQPLHQGFFSATKCVRSQIMELQIRVKFLRKQLWPMQTRAETTGISCFSVTLCWVLSLWMVLQTVSYYEYCSCEKSLHGCNRTAADGAGLSHSWHWTGNEGCAGRCSWSWDWRVDPALDALYWSKDKYHCSTLAHKALRKLRHSNMGWSLNSGVILFISNTVTPEFLETYSANHSSSPCKSSDF